MEACVPLRWCVCVDTKAEMQMQDAELEEVFPGYSRLLRKEEMKASGKSGAAGQPQEWSEGEKSAE